MAKKNLETLILDLLEVILKSSEGDNSLSKSQEKAFHDLQAEIVERLLSDADKPLLLSDKKLKGVLSLVIPHLFNSEDREYLYERLDESGLSVRIVSSFLDRFLNLKPMLLISALPVNINLLLSDAIRSYLYGCNRAAVILCGAILEESLKESLSKIDQALVYRKDNGDRPMQLTMPTIIDNAIKENVLDANFEKKAKYTVNKERNNAVHYCKIHNDKETLKIIEAVKAIMENIYGRKQTTIKGN